MILKSARQFQFTFRFFLERIDSRPCRAYEKRPQDFRSRYGKRPGKTRRNRLGPQTASTAAAYNCSRPAAGCSPDSFRSGHDRIFMEKPSIGGLVSNYIVERRQQLATGEFGNWVIAGSSLNNDVRLIEQPRSVQLEYHVKATNAAGASMPSNSIPVMLL